MQCKNHPGRKAEHFCDSCNAPICSDCAEEIKTGVHRCFQCAMFHSVSDVGSDILDKRDKTSKKKTKKKPWGPFQYFLVLSSVLIAVMWGVIIFGGESPPQRTIDFAKKGRILLFMVDGSLKRFAHYEGNLYPNELIELIPKYLYFRESELVHLKKLSYRKDSQKGYLLFLSHPKEGGMNLILSAKGIEHAPSSGGGIK